MDTRLEQQLRFIAEIDRLKGVVRRTLLLDGSRCENAAEHSWQLALMVLTLGEYAPEGTDLGHVLKLVLVHDLVEIDAGDVYVFDDAAREANKAREEAAAERLFSLLPEEQGAELRALWHEFEAAETPSARFAGALDRLQPMLHNLWTKGQKWHEFGVKAEQVRSKAARVQAGCPRLYEPLVALLDEAVVSGVLPS